MTVFACKVVLASPHENCYVDQQNAMVRTAGTEIALREKVECILEI